MNEICQRSREFLAAVVADLQFDLSVSAEWNNEGCLLNLEGKDAHYLLSENGEMLDSFETLLFQMFGRELERQHRITCDAEGFRQNRRAELQAMARFAAQNVRKNEQPFTFGALNATERRVIHLILQKETDLHTESIGVGRDRRLQVRIK